MTDGSAARCASALHAVRELSGSLDLDRFHAALAEVAGELPRLVDRVDRAHAYLCPAAIDAFPHRNDQAIAQLRPGVSFCVAAWCHASLGRSPEVDRAAAYHLDALKRSWLVTGQGP